MEALTFFSAMNRGQFREEQGIEGSSYCIFLPRWRSWSPRTV